MHQGRWLKDRVQRAKLSVSEFARRVGVARSRVHAWFADEKIRMRMDVLWAVVEVLGLRKTVESHGYVYDRRDSGPPVAGSYAAEGVFSSLINERGARGRVRTPPQQPAKHELRIAGVADGLRVVEVGDSMPAVFDLPIAASGWVELERDGVSVNPSQWRDGWVIVRVKGDSMAPRFADGQLVLFRRLHADEDSPVVGHDYLFVRSDGSGTLKRLVDADDDEFTLQALNPKYPQPLVCSRDETVMIAEARFGVMDLPEVESDRGNPSRKPGRQRRRRVRED